MKSIIDTELGIDDAVTLLMILAHPNAETEAMTAALGNDSLVQAVHNLWGMVKPLPIKASEK